MTPCLCICVVRTRGENRLTEFNIVSLLLTKVGSCTDIKMLITCYFVLTAECIKYESDCLFLPNYV